MAGQGSRVVLVSPEQHKSFVWAADYLVSRKGIKVDAATHRKVIAVLQAAQSLPMSLPQYAAHTGKTSKNPKTGKVGAHGNLQRPWRFAQYHGKATAAGADKPIMDKLDTGFAMTDGELGRMLTTVKPLLVGAGIIEERGRKVQTDAERSASWAERTVKRIKTAEKSGIKGTAGTASDIPAGNFWALLGAAYKGTTGAALAKLWRATVTAMPTVTDGATSPAPASENMPKLSATGTDG